MVHELKILPKDYKAVWYGEKTFEVRKDDRDFKIGDILILKEYENGEYTGKQCHATISYILGRNEDEKQFVPEGYVILALG